MSRVVRYGYESHIAETDPVLCGDGASARVSTASFSTWFFELFKLDDLSTTNIIHRHELRIFRQAEHREETNQKKKHLVIMSNHTRQFHFSRTRENLLSDFK